MIVMGHFVGNRTFNLWIVVYLDSGITKQVPYATQPQSQCGSAMGWGSSYKIVIKTI